jgi:ubiquinone/menaquinone biosynthesis C-methylase UbiE
MANYNSQLAIARHNVLTSSDVSASYDLNNLFLSTIEPYIINNVQVLDIGTGNGFVLHIINHRYKNFNLRLIGLDLSQEMLNLAYKEENITYICGSNYKINLPDNSVDIITAKNVTRFSANELFRVLKKNGVFIFREYGKSKGMLEIASLFKERLIRSQTINYYIPKLQKAGLVTINVQEPILKRIYKDIDSVIATIKCYPFISEFSQKDELLIKNYFAGKKEISINADPFILVAQKQLGC